MLTVNLYTLEEIQEENAINWILCVCVCVCVVGLWAILPFSFMLFFIFHIFSYGNGSILISENSIFFKNKKKYVE